MNLSYPVAATKATLPTAVPTATATTSTQLLVLGVKATRESGYWFSSIPPDLFCKNSFAEEKGECLFMAWKAIF